MLDCVCQGRVKVKDNKQCSDEEKFHISTNNADRVLHLTF